MEEHIEFRGGAWLSVVPLGVFILATTGLVIAGAPVVEGMIMAAMAGISLGMVAARNAAVYTERVFALMANRTATVAIVAWLWAGAFSGILADSGFLAQLMAWLDRNVACGVRRAEGTIVALISFANLCVSVNTVAMITVGPLANELRKRHGIHPYRSANLMDTVSCSFPYILPYAATMVAATAIQRTLAERYSFVEVLPWASEAPYIFYSLLLFPVMIVAVVTGYGRKAG